MVCIFPFNYPDARRVAPISACVFLQRVSGNLKCLKNSRAFDADFEHPTFQAVLVQIRNLSYFTTKAHAILCAKDW